MHILSAVLAALALVGAIYTLAAAILATRFRSSAASDRGEASPVTILKPLKGAGAGLEDCLESILTQDRGGPKQIVFGVADAGDPAIAVARRLISDHPDCDCTLVIEAAVRGANRKVSNLTNMMAAAKHELLIVSDSDIAVPAAWLRTVVGELQQPQTGAVTCLYSGKALTGFWAKIAALGISYQFLPNAVFGYRAGLADPCTGATIALRRETLDAIGGFAAFADCLADDYEIGRAVRMSGLSVAVSSVTVEHACTEASLVEWWRHELRWARTIRMIEGAGYAGSLVTQPLPLALLALVIGGSGALPIAAAVAALVSRLFLKLAVDRRVKEGAGPLWLLPVRDVLWFAVFIVSFFGTRVRWREAQLQARRRAALQS
jgi:ceramide glucosyltransferase